MIYLILFIILVIFIGIYFSKSKEQFNVGKYYCSTCFDRSKSSCDKCTNCGYCVTSDGKGKCVPGDVNGPHYYKNCSQWYYDQPITKYFIIPARLGIPGYYNRYKQKYTKLVDLN